MSSEPQRGARSPAAEQAPRGETHEFGLATLVRTRTEPLLDALEGHLSGSREHAQGTGSYAFATAVVLGHDRPHSELVREAAKLHEIGKIYLPAELLTRRPDSLSAEEAQQVEGHFEAGYRLAHGAGIPTEVCVWVLRVRERFDGHGPEQLAAGSIPIESQIIRAACACDLALATSAFAPASPLSERRRAAIAELDRHAGTELDPRVAQALAGILERAA